MLVGMNLLMNKGSRVPIYGKMISVVVPCLLSCGFAGARSWKNDEGKSIEAELVGVRGDSAVLKMGAREFVAPISSLSSEDGEYIKKWQANPPTVPPKKLIGSSSCMHDGNSKCGSSRESFAGLRQDWERVHSERYVPRIFCPQADG